MNSRRLTGQTAGENKNVSPPPQMSAPDWLRYSGTRFVQKKTAG
jgi:hypothetical protein